MAQKPQDSSKSADNNPEKERALSAALAQIERQFGKGSMMRLGIKSSWRSLRVDGIARTGCRVGNWRSTSWSGGRNLGRSLQVKRR